MVYIQHSYNISFHTSIGKSPFKNSFGCLPPSHLDIAYVKQGGVREDIRRDALREKKLLRRSRKSIYKYKRHYKSHKKNARLGKINIEQRGCSRWETKNGYS